MTDLNYRAEIITKMLYIHLSAVSGGIAVDCNYCRKSFFDGSAIDLPDFDWLTAAALHIEDAHRGIYDRLC